MRLLARLCLPLLFIACSHAGNRIDELLLQGEYQQAAQEAEASLAAASDPASRWQARRDLARSWLRQSRYQEADPLLQSLLYGPDAIPADTLLYADVMDAWFEFLRENSRYQEAETAGNAALAMHKKLLGEQHLLVAESLNNLALLHQYRSNYHEAIRLHEQALNIRRALAGQLSRETAESLHNLGTLYSRQKNWPKARDYLQQAIDIKKQILPANHPSMLVSKARLGSALSSDKQYSAAISLLEEVLAAEQTVPKRNLVHQAIVLRELGDAHHSLRHVAEAERYYQQALTQFAATVGKTSYPYAVTLDSLGWLYKMNGKPEEGKRMLADAALLFDSFK